MLEDTPFPNLFSCGGSWKAQTFQKYVHWFLYPKSQDINKGSYLPTYLPNNPAFTSSRAKGYTLDVQMVIVYLVKIRILQIIAKDY